MLDGVYSWALIYEDDFLVARDKIGVKQLYYGRNEVGSWFFASELKALEKECGGVVIDSFPAGHYFTPSKGIAPFWFPSWLHWEDTLNRPNYETIRSSLIDATHKRLMADVVIGALLSSGLDSSLICAIAAKQLKCLPKLKTYSIGLCDSSDGIAASKVANFIGSSHKHILFTVEEGLSMINKVIWHLETYDVGTVRAAIVHFLLSKAVASDNVKVVLSGEGADELFGG
uniref:Glutamine amidotransferase type-2 domain-containing protein n=1 Tax=Ditylenchus dipsaci TaxID=166011 RepID=A0A915DBX9_9BILA